MPAPEVVIPTMEAVMNTVAGAGESVALWVKTMKDIMLCGANKDQTDWEFEWSNAVIKTGPDLETGAVVYGIVLGQKSSAAEADFVVIDADADGTVTFDGTAALANTVVFATQLPATATDGTFEYHPYAFHKGLLIGTTTHLCVLADGRDGTDTTTGDIEAYVLFRSGNTTVQE